METDNNCYVKLEETQNVITEQIRDNGDMVGLYTLVLICLSITCGRLMVFSRYSGFLGSTNRTDRHDITDTCILLKVDHHDENRNTININRHMIRL